MHGNFDFTSSNGNQDTLANDRAKKAKQTSKEQCSEDMLSHALIVLLDCQGQTTNKLNDFLGSLGLIMFEIHQHMYENETLPSVSSSSP
jgi:hypothetical protein